MPIILVALLAMAQTLKVGDIVEWRIRAQGADRCTRGEVIAIIETRGRPCDKWPRSCRNRTADTFKVQEAQVCALHAIVREDLATGDVLPHPANRRRSEAGTDVGLPKKSEQYCRVTQPGSVLGSYPGSRWFKSSLCNDKHGGRSAPCVQRQRVLLSPKRVRGMADHGGGTGRQ